MSKYIQGVLTHRKDFKGHGTVKWIVSDVVYQVEVEKMINKQSLRVVGASFITAGVTMLLLNIITR